MLIKWWVGWPKKFVVTEPETIGVFSSDELEEIGWSADAYIETRFGKRNNERQVSFTSELTRSTLITTEPV